MKGRKVIAKRGLVNPIESTYTDNEFNAEHEHRQ